MLDADRDLLVAGGLELRVPPAQVGMNYGIENHPLPPKAPPADALPGHLREPRRPPARPQDPWQQDADGRAPPPPPYPPLEWPPNNVHPREWEERLRRLQRQRVGLTYGSTAALSAINQWGSALCSLCCASFWSGHAPGGWCTSHCAHPECLGIFGGQQRWHVRNHRRMACVLNDGHDGDCLCSAHAPLVRMELQCYRPLLGPADF